MNKKGPSQGFLTMSLGDWLELAKRTRTPHVPATRVTTIRVLDLLDYDTKGPHEERLRKAWAQMEACRKPDTMLRWDCCASGHLKHLMARAKLPTDPVTELQTLVIDERIYEIAGEYPRDELAVWQRPWIRDEMLVVERYPVEYRAFVRAGVVTGISSYYPQRALRRSDSEIDAVRHATERLSEQLKGPLVWPMPIHEHPEAPRPDEDLSGRNGVHFTADFVITKAGETLLLEGGPPHFAGAHPCCFDGRVPQGIALETHASTAQRDD